MLALSSCDERTISITTLTRSNRTGPRFGASGGNTGKLARYDTHPPVAKQRLALNVLPCGV